MKIRRWGAAMLSLAAVLLLTACGTSENIQEGIGSRTGASAQDSSGSVPGTSGTDSAGGTDGQGNQAEPDQGSPAGEELAASGQDSSAANGTDGQDGSAGAGTSQGAEGQQTEDLWSGTYVMDEETVTVSKLDDSTLSFSFAQSGISGTAAVDGSQAVYKGDDHYVVVFQVSGTVLEVSVSSEEDYDASGSPLNGTYIKEMS